ncbi:MAG TPA: hypothetical protein VFW83_07980 [Bryobacteraceae bacterium]|nr:hypothetical protein [Bryobacteraceae bacterium]
MHRYHVDVKPITIRNLPPKVEQQVRRRAAREKSSLNRTVAQLIEEGLRAPVPDEKKTARRHDLDFLFGVWTKEEADEFDQALASQRTIDPELWQ